MAIQYPCEVCGEHENELMLIGVNGKLMCPCCVKQLIVCMEAKIERLEEEAKEYWNFA